MVKGGATGEISYDKADSKSILLHASRLTGHTLRDFIKTGEVVIGGTDTKGYLGQMVERGYFLIENNNSPLPDFQEAGIELKVTPMKGSSGAGYTSKERLVLGIIDYDDVPERGFGIFEDKDSHILIVFYLWEEGCDILDYTFLKVVDWEPSPEEWRIFREDFAVIEGYIMRGEAHLLSERHTKFLAACTKGAGHGKDMRSQPFSDLPAKQRALSFKASFMTALFNSHPDINEILADDADYQSIIHGDWGEGESFEEHILSYYRPFEGMTCAEIETRLGLGLNPGSKQYYSALSLAMAGVVGKRHAREFEEAGILMKVVRTYLNGKPKESMSFPYIRFDDLVEQTWETSDFYDQLDHEFFTPVFSFTKEDWSSQSRKDLVFRGAFFWTIPDGDFEVIRGVWEDTKSKVMDGDFNHFIKASDRRISHVRPHARNSMDKATFRGVSVKKQSFWLNDSYIRGMVEEHLHNRQS